MTTYTFRVIKLEGDDRKMDMALNEQGTEGFRVVSTFVDHGDVWAVMEKASD
jgi:hypothetical protein